MKNVLNFTAIVGKLKKLKRTGWVKTNIPEPESVADHSFRTAILAMILAPQFGADQLKTVKMALVHDIAEAEIGDIITRVGNRIISDPLDKQLKERAAFKQIFSLIDNEEEYLQLFDELEQNSTPEAKIVNQLDQLEMAIQALEYEKEYGVELDSFYESTKFVLKDDRLKSILNEIENRREDNT